MGKPISGGDQRRDPDREGSTELLVDRVFPAGAPKADPRRVGRPGSSGLGGASGGPKTTADVETTLRHQASRLQRELNDAQRKLADHDDELAAEREMRQAVTSAHHALLAKYDTLVAKHEALAKGQDELATEREMRQVLLSTHHALVAKHEALEQASKTVEQELAAERLLVATIEGDAAQAKQDLEARVKLAAETATALEEDLAGERDLRQALIAKHAAERIDATADRAAFARMERELAEAVDRAARAEAEQVALAQRLATAIKTVEVLTQESRALRTADAAPTPRATTAPIVDDDLGEEELRVLYGDD